jgi:ankyrin repeat protein
MVDVLLESGLDPNHVDSNGSTPLAAAVSEQYDAVARHLISRGADPRVDGGTELIRAAAQFGSPNMLTYLLDKYQLPAEPKDNQNDSPLMRAGTVENARILLSHGANVEYQNSREETALFHAKDPEIAKLLIEHGADVNQRRSSGSTPLVYAAMQNSPKLIEMLLDNSADPSVVTQMGNSALHALFIQSPGITGDTSPADRAKIISQYRLSMEALMKAGVPAMPNQDGETPSQLAHRRGLDELVPSLERYEKGLLEPR